ncbi:MAG: hypothetical protein A2174_00430 [Candidatus Portnoybacteria bacterium RBG_13_41_18]|uniref:Cohesin domain-containing protein n=1 Tax=Candidatus Portnoybacteria bacterium RBG_13_41_18 TaxID=1801991 RepID=A0A1G2FBY6_9BACT|nr:MAG: hypothetical protein A2174_00430 [Candidatus Portnoybacteria bacterium RBG_13_41_18]
MRKYNFIVIQLIIVFFLIPVFPLNAALVGSTNQATLTFSAQAQNYNAGDNFSVSIFLNTNGQNVVVVAAYLSYDKIHFQAESIETTGSVFNFEAEKVIDAANGKIKITRGIPTPGVIVSSGLVAKINFKAISNVTPANDNVAFDFVAGSTNESNVILDDGRGTDILSGVYNGKYTVGVGGPLYYSNGSLLKANNSEKVYLIDNSQKRWIPNGEIFSTNGYLWSDIVVVEPSVLEQYTEGSSVAMVVKTFQEGAIIRAIGDIDVYIVKYVGAKKFKRLILSPSVFNSYGHLKWSNIKDIDKSVVDSFVTSDLVRAVSDPKVYRLYPSGDTGQKRWIETAGVFTRMNLDWDSIYEINQKDRDSYVTGPLLN